MTVYVVMEGEYSDRGMVGIYSNLEAAVACVGGMAERDISLVDVLDDVAEPGPMPPARELYRVTISLEGGFLAFDTNPRPSFDDVELASGGRCRVTKSRYHDTVYVESPVSFEHAAKVAVEKRQQWLRGALR